MDFKNILSQLSQLSEATKETGKGRVHTAEPGGYGRKDDEDDEGKKVKADAPKRGRGRPKKNADAETGEEKKYDWSQFGVKKDVKLKPWDKSKTTKHSLKEWVQEIEDKYVAEAGAPGQALQVKPMPGASQLVDPATQKVVATGPADKIKAMQGSIAKGEVTMTGGKMEEDSTGDYSAKKARAGKDIGKPGKQFSKIAASAGKKYGSKERGEKVAGAVLAKLRKTNEGDIPSTSGVDTQGAGLGAGRNSKVLEASKPDYIDLDKDGNKKESMKKAAKDKKKKVAESMDNRLKAAHLRGKAHALAKEGYNCRYDDMEEARMYHEGFKEGLDECYGQVPIRGQVVGEEDMPATVPGMADAAMDEGNAFTAALAKTPAGGKFSVGGKTFTDRSGYDSSMFESWDNQLNSLMEEFDTIQEGMTVSISKGQQGMPDSVSVTAQDHEAEQLLNVIKQAGLGLFGGDEPAQTSSSMSLQPADAGAESNIDVVDDHDGMMSLIKKVTGGAGEPDTVAIGGHDHEEEGACETCGQADCECDDEEQVDEVESEDQMAYEVAEENAPDSGAEETEQEVQDTAQANASAADSAGADDEGEEDEEEETDESEKLDEWANEAGQKGTDAAFEADIAFMTKVISGGLNKEKATGQTTAPVIPGQKDRMGYNINESISDWKKLAGLK